MNRNSTIAKFDVLSCTGMALKRRLLLDLLFLYMGWTLDGLTFYAPFLIFSLGMTR